MLRAATLLTLLLFAGVAAGDSLTVRYPAGSTSLFRGADGTVGDHRAWYGGPAQPVVNGPRPTHVVTYLHPYTGQNVNVPVTLPESTPRIHHATDRIVYNYGSYTVTSRFLPDGSVEVIYNSGLFRPLQLR